MQSTGWTGEDFSKEPGPRLDLTLRESHPPRNVLNIASGGLQQHVAALARHAGRLLTHRQVLTAVWGPAHQEDTQYLRVFIGQLRAKIEDDASAPQIIVTEPGVGYRFVKAAK